MELNANTLIPHQYTFELIEIAGNIIRSHPTITTIADPGTGSGIIALSLAKAFPHLRLFASDISRVALSTAKKNAYNNGVKTVFFYENRLGPGVWLWEYRKHKIDMIVANPPFIGLEEYYSPQFRKQWPESRYEPLTAITTTDPHGLEPFIDIFSNAHLLGTQYILFECNSLHIKRLVRLFEGKSKSLKIFKDSEGNERFIFVTLR